jgi:hypothetical protein
MQKLVRANTFIDNPFLDILSATSRSDPSRFESGSLKEGHNESERRMKRDSPAPITNGLNGPDE